MGNYFLNRLCKQKVFDDSDSIDEVYNQRLKTVMLPGLPLFWRGNEGEA